MPSLNELTRRLACTAGALLLAACAAAPPISTADLAVPLAYLRAASPTAGQPGQKLDYASAAPEQWWTQLQSARLNETIALSLAGNHDLAAATANLSAAQSLAGAANAARYPTVSLEASAGRDKYGAAFLGPTRLPPFTFYSLGPSVSYLVDLNGAVRAGIARQQATVAYQRFQRDEAYLLLTGNVALQALAIASARAQIATVETLLDADRTDLQLAQTAFDAGSATEVDLLNARSQLANDETELPPIRQQLSAARNALAVLVGRYPAQWSPPDFDLEELIVPSSLPVTLPAQLAHQRPDILATEAQLQVATAAVGLATADLYPQIRLTASGSLQSLTVEHLFDAASTAGTLMGNLTAPLFNHGALRARRQAASEYASAALLTYEQTVLRAFAQVADILEALDHDAEQLAAEQRAVATSTRNLALTRESYSAGYSGVLQVLEAERLFQRAQLGMLQARVRRCADVISLYLAIGGHAPALDQTP
jgi:NodT family efflux transporter outer membrane factor (OMF) lipoprotein